MSSLPSTAVRPAACLLLAVVASAGHLSADITAHLTLRATIFTRTRLTVSTSELRFHLANGDTAATSSLDFRAAARTSQGGEVILTVEADPWMDRSGGAGDRGATVRFEGTGEGTLDGVLLPRLPAVVGRWVGSGVHPGTLRFTLETPSPEPCRVPLRFVLTAP